MSTLEIDRQPLFGLLQSSRWLGSIGIPRRFALLSGLLAGLCLLAQSVILVGAMELSQGTSLLVTAGMAFVQAAAIYLAASRLSANIRALRDSTESIIAGDLDAPVNVECNCELGELSASFRRLVQRLNSDLWRKNLLTHTDALTGLSNRRVVTHLIGQLASADLVGCVLFIDIKGFKRVNDAFGYNLGDRLLRSIGERIARDGLDREIEQLDPGLNCFGQLERRPPHDIVLSRFAADQFVVLLPGIVDGASCARRANTILAALSAPFIIEGTKIRLSAKIGIARVPHDSCDASEVLRFADLATSAAKVRGDAWRFFDPGLRDAVVEQANLEGDLRHAIERNELRLHYQPQIDTQTDEVVGVEALLRWNHPERGAISPDVFVPIAEHIGLIAALNRLVLEMAMKQCAAWQKAGRNRRMAINISASQFDQTDVADEVAALIANTGVDPALIELEITESTAMSASEVALRQLDDLRKLGVHIAVDDFGTGFSNLSLLAKLPFTRLKIDKSLIDEIGRSQKGEVIVETVVKLAMGLGYVVVAEGVEKAEQSAFLKRLGCNLHQGFFYARPMAADVLEAWEQCRDRDRLGLTNQRVFPVV
jgi:diguanylate cyclase